MVGSEVFRDGPEVVSAGMEPVRARLDYHCSISLPMGRDRKAEISHVGVLAMRKSVTSQKWPGSAWRWPGPARRCPGPARRWPGPFLPSLKCFCFFCLAFLAVFAFFAVFADFCVLDRPSKIGC